MERGPYPDYEFRESRPKRLPIAWWIILSVSGLAVAGMWYLRHGHPTRPLDPFSRIRRALATVRYAKTSSWIVQGGRRILKERRYYALGRWRVESADGDIRIRTNAGTYELLPGHSTTIDYPAAEFSAAPKLGVFTIEDFNPSNNLGVATGFVSIRGADGRSYLRLTQPLLGGKLRLVCDVDPGTYLPTSVELQDEASPVVPWMAISVQETTYGGALSSSLFEPQLLASGKSGQVQVASKPAATEPEVQVYGASTNPRGDVFFTYRSLESRFEIKDQDGVVYAPKNLTLTFPLSPVAEVIGVPITGPLKPKPRTYTITAFPSLGYGNQTFTIAVDHAETAIVPTYPDPENPYPHTYPELAADELTAFKAYYYACLLAGHNSGLNQMIAPLRMTRSSALHREIDFIEQVRPLIQSDPRYTDGYRLSMLSSLSMDEGRAFSDLGMPKEAYKAYDLATNPGAPKMTTWPDISPGRPPYVQTRGQGLEP